MRSDFPPERERGGRGAKRHGAPEAFARGRGAFGGQLGGISGGVRRADGGQTGARWAAWGRRRPTDGRHGVGESGPPPVAAGGASYLYRHLGKGQMHPI